MSKNSTKTIAILSVSAGAGHVRAAEALKAAVENDYPGFRAVHVDVMDMVPKLFRKMYAESYLDIVNRHPVLWEFLYAKTDRVDHDSRLKKLRVAIERLNTKKLNKTLDELNPDTIICTHFLPAELFSRMIGRGDTDLDCWVQVTDFDVHSLWIHHHMTGYFAANPEVMWRMADRGIERERITVSGIPIMPAFSQPLSREECAQELGLDPEKLTLLMMSGGEGVGRLDVLAERVLGLEGDFQVVALAGKNQRMLEELNRVAEAHPGRLFPQGFTRTVERVMAACDVAVSKPGGLTTSECLAMGLPMVVISPIPGQEERNADYLLESGAGMKACDAAALAYRVDHLIRHPEKISTMRKQALAIATPGAANTVLDKVIEKLTEKE